MKKVVFSILIISLTNSLSIANETITSAKSKIKGVTVYLSGAQIQREAEISLKKGVSYIRFDHVSPYLNTNTIQVKGSGTYTILDVKKSSRYPEPKEEKSDIIPKEIKQSIDKLNDSISNYNFLIADITSKMTYLKIEKDILLKNNVFTKDSLATLKESLIYLREKLLDIHKKEHQYSKLKSKHAKEISAMQERLNKLQNYSSNHKSTINNSPIHFIEVTVQSTINTKGNMTVSYYIQQAGWSPIYDIRVKNTTSPVELMMKANVYQNSGEDWNEVPLTLSTNNPLKSKIKPQLQAWYLNYYYNGRGLYNSNEPMPMDSKIVEDDLLSESNEELSKRSSSSPAKLSTDYVVQSHLMASANYKISLPYTVKSNNQAHLVAVKQYEVACDYKYYIVPKYDRDAYIVANMVDWEDLDLLPSKANIFYDGTYIGETRINPTANDTLSLSLGNEPRIFAKRKRNKDKTKNKNKILSNHKATTISYDIHIKNNTGKTIEVIIQDHIPVSNDKTISIELESKSKAVYKEETGMLTWKLNLSQKTKEINYTYKITYEKDKSLNNLAL